MKKFNKVINIIEKVIITIDSALLIAITAIVVIQVAARKMNITLSGTEELARYGYVIFAFLAWPIAALRGTDIQITFLFDKLPAKVRTRVLMIFHAAMSIFACICAYSMVLNIQNAQGIIAASNRWLKVSWVYIIVMAGLAATVLCNWIRIYYLAMGQAVYLSQEEKDSIQLEEAKKEFESHEKEREVRK